MANSADPDKPTDLDLHCLQRQDSANPDQLDISGFSRTRVKCELESKIPLRKLLTPKSFSEEKVLKDKIRDR